jgi:uncharacterized protein
LISVLDCRLSLESRLRHLGGVSLITGIKTTPIPALNPQGESAVTLSGLTSRRGFLRTSVGAAGAAWMASHGVSASASAAAASASRHHRIIDCHAHLQFHSSPDYQEKDRRLIEAADKLGIDQLCASILTPKRPATLEGFRQCNAFLVEGIGRFPGRVLGYCYVNPGYTREAVEEIRRCVEEHSFIGVKLYNEHFADDPVVFPIVETTIQLGVPILHHAGHSHYFNKEQPHISDGARIAALARRYPEATLICAHIGGGGDWEWTIKALRHARNVFLDTSGSVVDEGMVDMAVRVLGVDRILFGCDMSMTASVGKIRAANLTEEERQRVLGGNMQRILAMRKK